MSLIIKGMRLPEDCGSCRFRSYSRCVITGTIVVPFRHKERKASCPVEEIPQHGRLIDADAIIKSLMVDPVECPGCPEPEELGEIIDILNEAPTAVEAEEGE